MSEEGGFLQAIVAHPEDATPRLVYADWLDEHDTGDGRRAARAEFIRVQCQLTRLPEGDSRRRQLQDREEELLDRHGEEWVAPLRTALPELSQWDVGYTLGFPSSVLLYRMYDVHQAAALTVVPPLQEIHLYLPGRGMGAQDAMTLASDPRLRGLTHLRLDDNPIGDNGAIALAASPHLQNLTHLGLKNNLIAYPGIEALAQSPHLQQLRVLDLRGNYIDDAGGRELLRSLRSGPLRNLTTLHLGYGSEISLRLRETIDRELARHRDQAAGRS